MSESSQTKPILSIKDLRIYFESRGRWVYAVDGTSMELYPGEGMAIIGESGSGKTLTMLSTLALISGYPGVVGGSISYSEDDFSIELLSDLKDFFDCSKRPARAKKEPQLWIRDYRKRAKLLAGSKIGIIFQNPIDSLDPLWTVGATIKESIRLRSPKMAKKDVFEEALEWLDRVHIKSPEGVMRSYPHQLSGGMCQRVMIASTLAMRPRIIIADEPTTGLDMTTKAQVLALLRKARDEYGSALIFVTHEINLVTGLTEKVVVMRKGKVVDRFSTKELADVKLVDGKLESSFDFDEHTKELLECSLALEQHHTDSEGSTSLT